MYNTISHTGLLLASHQAGLARWEVDPSQAIFEQAQKLQVKIPSALFVPDASFCLCVCSNKGSIATSSFRQVLFASPFSQSL